VLACCGAVADPVSLVTGLRRCAYGGAELVAVDLAQVAFCSRARASQAARRPPLVVRDQERAALREQQGQRDRRLGDGGGRAPDRHRRGLKCRIRYRSARSDGCGGKPWSVVT
jgi:hypothetical protein